MAFKMAASLAYKTGLAQAGPVLLEPIGKLEVHIPEENMGDIIGDLNKRRGQVLGMGRDNESLSVVEARFPWPKCTATSSICAPSPAARLLQL
jgi:elongation factor G